MIKKAITILLIILTTCSLKGQNSTPIDTDRGATPIIESILKKYEAFTSINMEVKITGMKEKKTINTLEGLLKIKQEKYFLQIDGQTIGCNGAFIWNFQKESNEVSLYPLEDIEDPIFHPTKLLSNWKETYTAKFIREEKDSDKTIQIIDLTPKSRMSYFKVRIKIDKKKNELMLFELYEKEGTIYTYLITKFVTNITMPDTDFEFNEASFPGVFVNDMR